MTAAGFDTKFVNFARGLVEGSTSKIHANEPLMVLLKGEQAAGRLHGLKLTNSREALYNLYTDDSGVFLQATFENLEALMATIGTYESISGAKLNIEKSIIIPVGLATFLFGCNSRGVI
ncbi:hypothetical protein R1sor_001800 [Riccia sorocarpa]|uniref:Uncharacterized protein n=1 Tax=Riccia sorocarpa TaxID=122646 RepID=A0ABD3GWY5_9MARC